MSEFLLKAVEYYCFCYFYYGVDVAAGEAEGVGEATGTGSLWVTGGLSGVPSLFTSWIAKVRFPGATFFQV